VTCQSYSMYVHFRGVTKWVTQACTIPIKVAQKIVYIYDGFWKQHEVDFSLDHDAMAYMGPTWLVYL
jgi:hypothetical protein